MILGGGGYWKQEKSRSGPATDDLNQEGSLMGQLLARYGMITRGIHIANKHSSHPSPRSSSTKRWIPISTVHQRNLYECYVQNNSQIPVEVNKLQIGSSGHGSSRSGFSHCEYGANDGNDGAKMRSQFGCSNLQLVQNYPSLKAEDILGKRQVMFLSHAFRRAASETLKGSNASCPH